MHELLVALKIWLIDLLEPNEEVVKLQSFNFLTPANWGVSTVSLQNVPESAGDGGIFSFFICCAKPGLWIKVKCLSQARPWNEHLTTK